MNTLISKDQYLIPVTNHKYNSNYISLNTNIKSIHQVEYKCTINIDIVGVCICFRVYSCIYYIECKKSLYLLELVLLITR